MKIGTGILLILLQLLQAGNLYRRTSDRSVADRPILLQTMSQDTAFAEDIDALDIILSYRFKYVKNDTAASNRLMKEQSSFLREMKLPVDGIQEAQKRNEAYLKDLLANYDRKLAALKEHPHRDLYRQICSQMLVKYICAENLLTEADLRPPHNKLVFLLNEMRESGGINIGLFYTAFLKFQYKNFKGDICDKLNQVVPYCNVLYETGKKDLDEMKATSGELLPVDIFIISDQEKRVAVNREYIMKMQLMQKRFCSK